MIDTTNWSYFYKVDYAHKHNVTTNLLYTPTVSPDGSMLCMLWDENSEYQKENTDLTEELINFFFEREVKYLQLFQGKPWCPKLIELDLTARKIIIEFNKETFNHIVTDSTRTLDLECPNWKEQIFEIVKDIHTMDYYKMALYPHCFFVDAQGQIKTIDFYSFLEKQNRMLEKKKIEGMIGRDSVGRFAEATVGDKVDFGIFFERTMMTHLGRTWTDNPFPEYYTKINNG